MEVGSGIVVNTPSASWVQTQSASITWTDNISDQVKIDLFKGSNFVRTLAASRLSDGTYSYVVASDLAVGTDYKIKITSVNDANLFGESNAFAIQAAAISVTTPSSAWVQGQSTTITWTDNISENVKIELVKGSSVVRTIAASTASDVSDTYAVPNDLAEGTDYKLKISSISTASVFGESTLFSVSRPPFITANTPSASWTQSESVTIIWTDNISENVKIELYKGSSLSQTIVSSTSIDGSYAYTVPANLTAGTDYKIKITSTTNTSLSAESSTFEVKEASGIVVNTPSSAWVLTQMTNITWTDNISGHVKIDLFKGDNFVQTLVSSTVSDGTHSYTVPSSLEAGTDYKLKISSVDDSSVSDESNTFSIVAASISVTTPSSAWIQGENLTIAWTDNISENVKIELIKGSSVVQTIVASTTSDGSYAYTVPSTQTLGTDYMLRITSTSNSSLYVESNSFEVSYPTTMTYNGKTYQVIKIGDQIWMAENLNDDGHTSGTSSCYDNDASNCTTYGRLYDWDAAVDIASKVSGWHLPSDEEWKTLERSLGMSDSDADATGWRDSGSVGTALEQGGSSGFEALLAGWSFGSSFYRLGSYGYFWSATAEGSSDAWLRVVSSFFSGVHRSYYNQSSQYSVRLLKD